MSNRLYVGNLSYSVDDAELWELFAAYGAVTLAKVARDFHTGRSKGFGFVMMATVEEAEQAAAALNGTEYRRRILVVHTTSRDASND